MYDCAKFKPLLAHSAAPCASLRCANFVNSLFRRFPPQFGRLLLRRRRWWRDTLGLPRLKGRAVFRSSLYNAALPLTFKHTSVLYATVLHKAVYAQKGELAGKRGEAPTNSLPSPSFGAEKCGLPGKIDGLGVAAIASVSPGNPRPQVYSRHGKDGSGGNGGDGGDGDGDGTRLTSVKGPKCVEYSGMWVLKEGQPVYVRMYVCVWVGEGGRERRPLRRRRRRRQRRSRQRRGPPTLSSPPRGTDFSIVPSFRGRPERESLPSLFWVVNFTLGLFFRFGRKLLSATVRRGRMGFFHWIGSDSWGAKIHPVRHQERAAEGAITILPKRSSLTGEERKKERRCQKEKICLFWGGRAKTTFLKQIVPQSINLPCTREKAHN